MNELPQSLPCLLLPLQSGGLIIPNANVVEVALAGQLSSTISSPFILGMMAWRQAQIPVMSFEGLLAGRMPNNLALRQVAILRGLHHPGQLPYYGLALAAVPQVVHIGASDLLQVEGDVPTACQSRVGLGGATLMVPDCAVIEQRLLDALSPAEALE